MEIPVPYRSHHEIYARNRNIQGVQDKHGNSGVLGFFNCILWNWTSLFRKHSDKDQGYFWQVVMRKLHSCQFMSVLCLEVNNSPYVRYDS